MKTNSCLSLCLSAIVTALIWTLPGTSFAQAPKPAKTKVQTASIPQVVPPQKVVEQFAERALSSAKRNKEKPEVFRGDVDQLLGELMNFETFSQRVMGKMASEKNLLRLPAKEQKKLRNQIRHFSSIFRHSLVNAYSNAFLLAAEGVKVKTLPPSKPVDRNRSSVVKQQLSGLTENAVDILYQMEFTDNRWQLRNISVAGINLGKLYRTQFQTTLDKHKGDIDKAINQWSVDSGQ